MLKVLNDFCAMSKHHNMLVQLIKVWVVLTYVIAAVIAWMPGVWFWFATLIILCIAWIIVLISALMQCFEIGESYKGWWPYEEKADE